MHKRRRSSDEKPYQDLLAHTDRLDELLAAGRDASILSVQDASEKVKDVLGASFAADTKGSLREYLEAVLWAVVIAMVIRILLFEAFKIPTGSMVPTLQIDDHIFVNKLVYGLRVPFTTVRLFELFSPARGDVVVFGFPGEGPDEGKDFIKRVIGIPGDAVRLEDNVIFIDDVPVPTVPLFDGAACMDDGPPGCTCSFQIETLGDHSYVTQHHVGACTNDPDWPTEDAACGMFDFGACDYFGDADSNPDWPEVVVPPGHLLVMGDNRDNSSDGRHWGLVPTSHLVGKAVAIWWATDSKRLFSLVH